MKMMKNREKLNPNILKIHRGPNSALVYINNNFFFFFFAPFFYFSVYQLYRNNTI